MAAAAAGRDASMSWVASTASVNEDTSVTASPAIRYFDEETCPRLMKTMSSPTSRVDAASFASVTRVKVP